MGSVKSLRCVICGWIISLVTYHGNLSPIVVDFFLSKRHFLSFFFSVGPLNTSSFNCLDVDLTSTSSSFSLFGFGESNVQCVNVNKKAAPCVVASGNSFSVRSISAALPADPGSLWEANTKSKSDSLFYQCSCLVMEDAPMLQLMAEVKKPWTKKTMQQKSQLLTRKQQTSCQYVTDSDYYVQMFREYVVFKSEQIPAVG